ncbi:hypothetical protein GCM10027047_01210 [Rhodococcus aerolatus]
MHQSPLLTTRQVADRLAVDASTVRRWVLTGQLVPALTTPGGHHRFSVESIDNLSATATTEQPA